MIGSNLLDPMKEVGLTTNEKMTSHNKLQWLQITKRLSNHPRWTKHELETLFSNLGPQQLPLKPFHVVGSVQQHAQAFIHAFAA